jgi:tRNA-uridine 2-sulfurtransferase
MKKALVLYSGGLDSRLVVRMLQDQGLKVEALYFALPFGCGCCNLNCNFKFTQKEETKMTIFDVTKEPLLGEYLKLLKNPKHGTGSGINPCKDCKIFMFKKAKEYADKHKMEVIATGEVLGQRPMSQIRSSMKKIDEALGFEILRPLSAKCLDETSYEKKGLVDREKLYGIKGRGRKRQMGLAKEFGIEYPTPGGGCFLCEKEASKRLKVLLENNLIDEKTLPITMLGRHFLIDNIWFIVARNSNECEILDKFKIILPGGKGKPTVYFNKKSGEQKAKELQKAYSTGADEKEREKWEKLKL